MTSAISQKKPQVAPRTHPKGIRAEQMSNGHPICHYLFHIKGSVEVSNGWEHLGEYHSVSGQFQCHKVSIVFAVNTGLFVRQQLVAPSIALLQIATFGC